jgi:hypothetical protein
MGDFKGMGSAPGNVQGAGLTRRGDTAGNVRDAIEKVSRRTSTTSVQTLNSLTAIW